MLHQYRFVVVIALLGLAAALATEKGKLPLALRGLKKTLRRDAGVQPAADARHAGVPVWKRLVALVLCALAFAVAAAGSTWVGDLPGTFKSGAAVPSLDVTGPRAQFVAGDWTRFAHVFARLERGEAVRIAVIGGSITQGAGASGRANQWGSKFTAGWRRAFPSAKIDFVNAGIGATGSAIGAFRLARDVLAKQPDAVVVEFSVNDAPGRECAESYEGCDFISLKK